MPTNQFHEMLDLYKNNFEPKHRENVTNYFDELLAQSKVDANENAKIVSDINDNQNVLNTLRSKKSTNTMLIILVFIVGFFSTLIISIKMSNGSMHLAFIALVIPVAIATILLLILLNKKRKELISEIQSIYNIVSKKTDEAWKQMNNLNNLYDSGISNELLTKTIPLIKMDKNFDIKRYDQLLSQYGFDDIRSDDSSSAILCQTGEINGNPFLIGRTRETYMGTASYTGEKIISWTTRDSEGNLISHSETLTATIYKPCPYYNHNTKLYYGNDAAPNLSFSRSPGNIHLKNEKSLEKHLKREGAKLTKHAEKSVRKGGDFTLSTNIDFEVMFNAVNRNNEQEFRLLFTPLAQNQMMKLLKNENSSGYGDNFYFTKSKKMNIISSNELSLADLTDNPRRYYDYDLKKARNYFISYNMKYLKDIFWGLVPVLNIPLYQQTKSHKFIYKDVYPAYYSNWQHETIANSFEHSFVNHHSSVTENILKTRLVSKNGDSDKIEISSYGYRTENRVEYVSKLGGDGHMHDIAIHWLEYIPVSRKTLAQISNTTYKFNDFMNIDMPDIPEVTPLLYKNSTISFVYKDGIDESNQDIALKNFFSMFDNQKNDNDIEDLIDELTGDDSTNIEDIIDNIGDSDDNYNN